MNFSFCDGRADYRLSYFEKVSFPLNSSIIKKEDVVSEEKDNITSQISASKTSTFEIHLCIVW